MVRRDKVGTRGRNARAPYSEGWKPPVREYPPLPTSDSPLADKVTAIVIYSGPYLIPGQAAQAAHEHYGVPYPQFLQFVALLAYDPEAIAAKPRETRLMREQMERRRTQRRLSRERGAAHPLRYARKPPTP